MSAVVAFPRIHPLATEVANQIAAGEVIERPASVVKELLENSIDAAATRIKIDIDKAGSSRIRVQDNGQGIHRDDLELALMAHATSKLSRLSDLSQIVSLGFRGEALPSIASVARLTLTSRMQGGEQAWSIDNSGVVKPAAHAAGTTVDVQDLFHATPARRKFLKSKRTEFLHIQSLVKTIALAHHAIGFQLTHDGQQQLNLVSSLDNPQRRLRDILGKSFLEKSVVVNAERNGMHLWGWMGLNSLARSQSDRMYFFLNGRSVQDKQVNHAIRLANTDRIDTGRFPSYVLYLQLDPARVDINVHPAKSEVRFAEARDVHDFIYAALTAALSSGSQSRLDFAETESEKRHNSHRIQDAGAKYQSEQFAAADMLYRTVPHNPWLALHDGSFVIAEFGEAYLLIDTNNSRILLTEDELLGDYRAARIVQRALLVPVSCELAQQQIERLGKHENIIQRWGFVLEQVAPTRVAVRAIPENLPYADTVAVVKDLLKQVPTEDNVEEVAAVLAAHANDARLPVTVDYVDQLLQQIKDYEARYGVSDSRPWRRLDATALARLLK